MKFDYVLNDGEKVYELHQTKQKVKVLMLMEGQVSNELGFRTWLKKIGRWSQHLLVSNNTISYQEPILEET